jgi:cytochrome c biogenesis protein
MSETARTRPLPGAQEPIDDLEGGISFADLDVFERIWHFFISMRTGLALILVLAILTLVGTVLVQAPAGMTADREAYAAWLETVRPKYGGWTNVLDVLGFFSIFNSLLFRSLTVLLSTSILACSINRAPRLWKQAVHPRTVMSGGFYQHAALRASLPVATDPATAAGALEAELRGKRYRTIATPSADGIDIYADRFRWGPFGTVIAHLSIILILAGAIIGATGFRDTEFAAPIGTTMEVGNATGLTLEATSFSDSYYDNGSPSDYASHLVLYKDGQQVAEQTIRVNDPMTYGDVTFYQSFFGPAADLLVKDNLGATLYSQGVPLRWSSSDGTKAIGQFDIPSKGYTVYVIGAASGRVDPTIAAGQMQLEIYDTASASNTPVAIQVVTQGQPATIAGLDFTFERERQFTGLIVARDPGAPFVWAGALFLVLGVALVFFFPNRRIWARARAASEGSLVEIGALTRHDVMFEAGFGSLVDNVKVALTGAKAS